MGLPEKSQHFKSSQVSTVAVNFRVNFDFQMSHGQSVPEQGLIKKTENPCWPSSYFMAHAGNSPGKVIVSPRGCRYPEPASRVRLLSWDCKRVLAPMMRLGQCDCHRGRVLNTSCEWKISKSFEKYMYKSYFLKSKSKLHLGLSLPILLTELICRE